MELSPDQFSSLKYILSEPAAQVAAIVPIQVEGMESILASLQKAVQRQAPILGANRLLFKIDPARTGGRVLNDRVLAELVRQQTPVVTLGADGTLLASAVGNATLVEAARESLVGPAVCILATATQLGVFAAGRVVADIGTEPPDIRGRGDWRRSWRDLKKCFDDHFESRIENQKGFQYWENRVNRVLLAEPVKTEKLFHHDLFWWCNNFVVDALTVFGEAQAMGQDKTDITIVTEVGNIVIEIKWLGRNVNGSEYAQVRIREGMEQVADYLKRDNRLMQGYLVMYDARTETAHHGESSYPASCRHDKCEEPVIYFLRSESPSERATRVAAETQP